MRLIKNKRGVSVPLFMFELLVAAVVLIGMMQLAIKAAQGDINTRQFIAKDTALVIDSLHALPGDVMFAYAATNDSTELFLNVLNGYSEVSSKGGLTFKTEYRQGSLTVNSQSVDLAANATNFISFQKQGESLLISKQS